MSERLIDLRIMIIAAIVGLAAVSGTQSFGGENVSDTAMLIQPGISVGNVRAGMAIAEVVSMLGKPDSQSETGARYSRMGFEVVFKNGVVRLVICGNDGPASAPAGAFKGRTKEGIGIGSSRGEVIKAFGEPDRVEIMGVREELSYRAKALHFSLNKSDDKVVCIQVGFPGTNSPAALQSSGNGLVPPGYATPEDTFKSYRRAVNDRDVKAILACFTLEDQKVMEPKWQQLAARDGDAFLARMARDLEGLQITGKRLISGNEVELTMSHSNEPSRLVWFKKNGADWKLWSKAEATATR